MSERGARPLVAGDNKVKAYTKEAQRMILIGDATCSALGGRMPVTLLGLLHLKGKAASVDVFAVDA